MATFSRPYLSEAWAAANNLYPETSLSTKQKWGKGLLAFSAGMGQGHDFESRIRGGLTGVSSWLLNQDPDKNAEKRRAAFMRMAPWFEPEDPDIADWVVTEPFGRFDTPGRYQFTEQDAAAWAAEHGGKFHPWSKPTSTGGNPTEWQANDERFRYLTNKLVTEGLTSDESLEHRSLGNWFQDSQIKWVDDPKNPGYSILKRSAKNDTWGDVRRTHPGFDWDTYLHEDFVNQISPEVVEDEPEVVTREGRPWFRHDYNTQGVPENVPEAQEEPADVLRPDFYSGRRPDLYEDPDAGIAEEIPFHGILPRQDPRSVFPKSKPIFEPEYPLLDTPSIVPPLHQERWGQLGEAGLADDPGATATGPYRLNPDGSRTYFPPVVEAPPAVETPRADNLTVPPYSFRGEESGIPSAIPENYPRLPIPDLNAPQTEGKRQFELPLFRADDAESLTSSVPSVEDDYNWGHDAPTPWWLEPGKFAERSYPKEETITPQIPVPEPEVEAAPEEPADSSGSRPWWHYKPSTGELRTPLELEAYEARYPHLDPNRPHYFKEKRHTNDDGSYSIEYPDGTVKNFDANSMPVEEAEQEQHGSVFDGWFITGAQAHEPVDPIKLIGTDPMDRPRAPGPYPGDMGDYQTAIPNEIYEEVSDYLTRAGVNIKPGIDTSDDDYLHVIGRRKDEDSAETAIRQAQAREAIRNTLMGLLMLERHGSNTPVIRSIMNTFGRSGYTREAMNQLNLGMLNGLRADTGAAVTDTEFERYDQLYLPQMMTRRDFVVSKAQSQVTKMTDMLNTTSQQENIPTINVAEFLDYYLNTSEGRAQEGELRAPPGQTVPFFDLFK